MLVVFREQDMNYDNEFRYEVQHMLERFCENNLGAVDGKVIGIPFVVQNIVALFMKHHHRS